MRKGVLQINGLDIFHKKLFGTIDMLNIYTLSKIFHAQYILSWNAVHSHSSELIGIKKFHQKKGIVKALSTC
jgi:hypothetical protein